LSAFGFFGGKRESHHLGFAGLMNVESTLQTLNLKLPTAPAAMATYAPAVRSGNLLFVAGQGPMVNGKPLATGKLGANVSVEQGQECARAACLNALAVAKQHLGSLDKIKRAVQATVWVACTPNFTEHPKIANGATELIKQVWGEGALPARAAVGANVLPMDIPVEVALVFEVG
jgi:enamine deaminase RidA (YjgF/YER057c/UK114 family)